MVQINFAQKQVNAKIVYYGPGMSGKTTNLEIIHQRAPKANRGELTSISTDGDRTLFFDFMPLDLGTVAGMRTCFQIYTVPGQVYYNSTRKLVLQGVDGVIFVADSSASMLEENFESMRNLEANLAEYGRNLEELPLVIQYNKRDLPDAMPVEELDARLNPGHVPAFEGIAHTGQGVFPTLKALAARVIENIHNQQRSAVSPAGVTGAASIASAPAALPTEAAFLQTGFHAAPSGVAEPEPAATAARTREEAAVPAAPQSRRHAPAAPEAARPRARGPVAPTAAGGATNSSAGEAHDGSGVPAAAASPAGGSLRLAGKSRDRESLPRPSGRAPRMAASNNGTTPAGRRSAASPALKRPRDAQSMKLASKRSAAPAQTPPAAQKRANAERQQQGGSAPLRRTPRPTPVQKRGSRSALLTGIIVVASIGIGAALGSLVLSIL